MASLLLINGPNLNLLGTREPELYGATTLTDIETRLQAEAEALGHSFAALQSNAEAELVDRVLLFDEVLAYGADDLRQVLACGDHAPSTDRVDGA